MRLLSTDLRDGLCLREFSDGAEIPEYAILSHTWAQRGEVTYKDIVVNRYHARAASKKIRGACRKAAEDGFEWIWIDSCNIDKGSSAELSEAINKMYDWYAKAMVCYAHLADYDPAKGLEKCNWFKRGWTLQELIAPRNVEFYDAEWNEVGTKRSMKVQLAQITGIDLNVLAGAHPHICCAAQRMSWMALRNCTRPEDMAYCLLGLFGVTMPLLYGEGLRRAFLRLQEQILKHTSDHTLFLSYEPGNGTVLAESPHSFDPVHVNPHFGGYLDIQTLNAEEYRSFLGPRSNKGEWSAGASLVTGPYEVGMHVWLYRHGVPGWQKQSTVLILNAFKRNRPFALRLSQAEPDSPAGNRYLLSRDCEVVHLEDEEWAHLRGAGPKLRTILLYTDAPRAPDSRLRPLDSARRQHDLQVVLRSQLYGPSRYWVAFTQSSSRESSVWGVVSINLTSCTGDAASHHAVLFYCFNRYNDFDLKAHIVPGHQLDQHIELLRPQYPRRISSHTWGRHTRSRHDSVTDAIRPESPTSARRGSVRYAGDLHWITEDRALSAIDYDASQTTDRVPLRFEGRELRCSVRRLPNKPGFRALADQDTPYGDFEYIQICIHESVPTEVQEPQFATMSNESRQAFLRRSVFGKYPGITMLEQHVGAHGTCNTPLDPEWVSLEDPPAP